MITKIYKNVFNKGQIFLNNRERLWKFYNLFRFWDLDERTFDPQKSFFSLRIVKTAFLIWIGFALISGFVITLCTQGLEQDLSANGFNTFLELYKFPLWTLTSAIPIFALLGFNHRSEQSAKQIEETKKTNNLNLYFKHINEFESHVSKLLESKDFGGIKIRDPKFTHRRLFSNEELRRGKIAGIESTERSLKIHIISYLRYLQNGLEIGFGKAEAVSALGHIESVENTLGIERRMGFTIKPNMAGLDNTAINDRGLSVGTNAPFFFKDMGLRLEFIEQIIHFDSSIYPDISMALIFAQDVKMEEIEQLDLNDLDSSIHFRIPYHVRLSDDYFSI